MKKFVIRPVNTRNMNEKFTNDLSKQDEPRIKGVCEVRRSKLELYEAVLEVLVKEPLVVDDIAYQINIDCTALGRYLGFLIKNDLVEERSSNEETLYAITERGIAVLKTLNFQKYLEKVMNSVMALDDALQTVSVISKRNSEQKKKSE
ncbi:MAG: winged helix-turn-helix domain-containing protein [Candidatus Bathyarchaeota archaeon]|nr:winged helix-turn-helix domain-containing protein [Candidatus Bathyarchaeota archaeon]MDH5786800.1 winged helix-turn-helix domain-containing protein [Candidatus Bathyarchaeota archaeon]